MSEGIREIAGDDSDSSTAEERVPPRFDIVCYLLAEWDTLPRRPHLSALARFGRVLLVQVPMNVISPIQKPRKFLRWLTGRNGPRAIADSLYMCRPAAAVPFGIAFQYPWLRPVNRWLAGRAIRRYLRQLDFKPKAAIIFDPAQDFFIGLAGEEVLCYEIIDQYADYPAFSVAQREQIIREEQALLRRADVVFVPHSGFLEEKSRHQPNTHIISNTAEVESFVKAQSRETRLPEDLTRIPAPRVGYIGNINHLMDCELLLFLSERNPEWSFVMLGNVNGDRNFRSSAGFRALQKRRNVHFLGWRDYALLPAYLAGMSAGIIPFVVNHNTKSHGQPNKLFQYLAAGKPVVSSALPAARDFSRQHGGLVDIAETYDEFEQLLAAALTNGENEQNVRDRIRVARMYSPDRSALRRVRLIADVSASRSLERQVSTDG